MADAPTAAPTPTAPAPTAATGGAPAAGKPGQAPNIAKEAAARGPQATQGTPTATKPPEPGAQSQTEPPEQPKKPIKKTLKYNGKDVTLEFNDEAHFDRELQRMYGEQQMARQFQEDRARLKRATEAARTAKDPFALYREVDPEFDPEEFLLTRTKELLDQEDRKKSDPKGWELEQAQKKIREYEEKAKAAEEQREQERIAQQAEQFKQRMAQEWGTELRRLGFDAEYTKANLIPRMVDLYEANKARGAGWTTAQMVDHIGWELRTAGINHIKSLRGQALLEALGPDLVNEIRRTNLEAANAIPPKPAPKPQPKDTPMTQKEKNEAMLNMGRSTWRFPR